jgi:hypothetical protein
MPKIKSPETFAPNQILAAADLQNHVDGSYPLPGFVTEQTAIAANGVASGDLVVISDVSDSDALKKATVSDILNSGVAITTSLINGSASADIVIDPVSGQKVDVAGPLNVDSLTVEGTTVLSGSLTTNGAMSSSTGTTTVSDNLTVSGNITSNGTANFTGVFHVNGATAYVLTEVVEETIAKFTATNNAQAYVVHTTASFTKPSDEIWVYEVEANTMGGASSGKCHIRITNDTDTLNYAVSNFVSNSAYWSQNHNFKWVIGTGTSYTGTYIVRTYNAISGVVFGPVAADYSSAGYQSHDSINKFRIYKYKTA